MFIRFVTHHIDPDSHQPAGIFQAAADLCEHAETCDLSRKQIKNLLSWFGDHLQVPSRFAKSKKTHAHNKGISWFKHDAHDHITRMRELCRILAEHHIRIQTLTTDRPGYILYEDDHQICAIPFKNA